MLNFIRPWIAFRLEKARELFGDRMTMVGGVNALTLASGDRKRIRDEVRRAVEVLAPTNRFILHPMDAIFPDTPWEGVEQMIEAWKSAGQDLRWKCHGRRGYAAVKELVDQHRWSADARLVSPFDGAGAPAASLLADEGIPLGCEGDVNGVAGQLMLSP